MASLLDLLDEKRREGLPEAAPGFSPPMLATLVHGAFSDPDWLFERKFDGERCLAVHDPMDRSVRLFSRNEKRIERAYPEIAEALARLARCQGYTADGEIVAFEGERTSFQALQPRMHSVPDAQTRADTPVCFYLFDLLTAEGRSLTRLPLRERKRLLREAFRFEDPLRFTEHRDAAGEDYLREACRAGWEGLIAKRADAPYAHARSRQWLKFKCGLGQEFVIGGYTEPKGSRTGFGALLLGYYRNDELVYAGRVGTGFDEETLTVLRERFDRLERRSPPFSPQSLPKSEKATWLRPVLVCEAGFSEWTRAGRLRHPRFLGLRRDKDAKSVTRED